MLISSYRPVVAISLILLSGCGALTDNDFIGGEDAVLRDRGQDYEMSGIAKALVIPAELDSDKIQDVLVVPEIGTAAIASDSEFEIPRPDFFIAEAGSDRVNLARDGQERLIIVNEPLPQVWGKLQTFWDEINQKIVLTDPQQGLMETAWIDSGEEPPGFFSRLVANLTFSEVQGPAQDKLRAYVKSVEGDRSKTSIRLRHLRSSVSDDRQAADWSDGFQDVDYKSQVMYEMLHYLSSSSLESTASAVRERQKLHDRVYLGRGSQGEPVLKLTTTVDDAWERIQQALLQAQVDVGSADKSLGKYYITHTSSIPVDNETSAGFFAWLHGERDAITFDTRGIGAVLGVAADENAPRYSSEVASQATPVVELSEEQAAVVAQQQRAESDGYKIWLGDKVIYNFGGRADERIAVDKDTGAATFTGQYQIKLSRRSSGVYVSVLLPSGAPAQKLVAEDILWTLKENMPAS